MREIGITDMNFLSDDRFLGFQKTLDARMKQLHSSGIGVSGKQAEPITPNKEERLWQSGQLGDGSSQSLFNTVFYYNCKLCGMRAMDKHCSLRAATNESQKTLNKCETRNKTVFHTRLRHPETINSVPLNSVLRIKQIGV